MFLVVFFIGLFLGMSGCASSGQRHVQQETVFKPTTYVVVDAFSVTQTARVETPDKHILAIPMAKPMPPRLGVTEVVENPLLLVGYKGDFIDDLFGQASISRKDGQSLIRQYYTQGCAMDVFLYDEIADEGSESYVIEHISVRANDNNARGCVEGFTRKKAIAYNEYMKRRG